MGAYDTEVAFERVFKHLTQSGVAEGLDHIVVTGDVADHGRAEQYDIAAQSLGRFEVLVNLCPGNHDFDLPFRAGFEDNPSNTTNLSTNRVIEREGWAFLFVDSNSGMMVAGDGDAMVDSDDGTRLHANGSLSDAEANWIAEACARTAAEHVFVWLHHPPGVENHFQAGPAYNQAWTELLADLPKVRGFGAGHLHMPTQWTIDDRPVFLGPSLKNNFSLDEGTWLPPGYRTYEFHPDGSIESQVHLVDDETLWPRLPIGRALRSFFTGELSGDELAEIVVRRQSQNR